MDFQSEDSICKKINVECVGTEGNQMNLSNGNATSPAEAKGKYELTDFDKSAISELVLAVCLVIYFFTFVREFHHISLSIVTKNEAEPRSLKPSNIQMTTHAV